MIEGTSDVQKRLLYCTSLYRPSMEIISQLIYYILAIAHFARALSLLHLPNVVYRHPV